MATFGNTTDNAFARNYTSDRKLVSRESPASNGVVTGGGVRIWCAVNAPAKMVIYSDTSNAPDSLLAMSDEITVTNTTEALNTFTFSGSNQISVVAGTFYWIGVHYDYTSSAVNVSRQDISGRIRSNDDIYSNGTTATFGATATTNGPIDAYIEYAEGATASLEPSEAELLASDVTATFTQPAITFRSSCDTLADFDYADGSVTQTADTGYTGGGLNIIYAGNFAQQVFRKAITPSNVVQFRFKIASAATMDSVAGDAVVYAEYTDPSYSGDANCPIQIRVIGNGAGFTFRIVSPADSFGGDYSSGTVFTKGRFHTAALGKTTTGYNLYVNNSETAVCAYTRTNPTATAQYLTFGNNFSVEDAIAGTVTFDDIFCRNRMTVTTAADEALEMAYSLEQRYDSGGAQVRPIDANDGVSAPRVVSESMAYKLLYTSQYLTEADMIRADNWCYQNLLARNGMSAPVNPATDAFNLMAFLYECDNYGIQDANRANDADHERGQALLWAHARWGSSSFTVGTPDELAAPNWLQRALDVLADLRDFAYALSSATGFYYLMNDHLQLGNDTVQLAPDYDNPAAYKLFKQYDTANAAFWDLCVAGAYDLQTKAAAYIFSPQTITSSMTPNWLQFQLSTATVTGTSTYGDSDWGYNSPRMKSRAYDDWVWYGDQRAADSIQLGRTFIEAEIVDHGLVYAEYRHDGQDKPLGSPYASRFFDGFYYFMVSVDNPSQTIADAFKADRLDSTFVNHPAGSYYSGPGYFNTHWNARNAAQVEGLYVNYGQAAAAVNAEVAPAAIDVEPVDVVANFASTAETIPALIDVSLAAVNATAVVVSNAVTTAAPVGMLVQNATAAHFSTAASAATELGLGLGEVNSTHQSTAQVVALSTAVEVQLVAATNVVESDMLPVGVSVVAVPTAATHESTADLEILHTRLLLPETTADYWSDAAADSAIVELQVGVVTAGSIVGSEMGTITAGLTLTVTAATYHWDAQVAPVTSELTLAEVQGSHASRAPSAGLPVVTTLPSVLASSDAVGAAQLDALSLENSVLPVVAIHHSRAELAPIAVSLILLTVAASPTESAALVTSAVIVDAPSVAASHWSTADASLVAMIGLATPAITGVAIENAVADIAPISLKALLAPVTVPGLSLPNQPVVMKTSRQYEPVRLRSRNAPVILKHRNN